MNKIDEIKLKILACEFRLKIVEIIFLAKSGHPGGSLSCIDFLTYVYFNKMNISSNNLNSASRDRFVLSKGHAAPALYCVLAKRGFFDESELKNLRQFGSILQGHPNMKTTPGIEMSTGSLGQGISTACGMALGLKLNKFNSKVYCLVGDGELEEGQVYEALMFAAHNKLNNLCVVVDNNGLQIDGTVQQVAGLQKIVEKFQAFNFEVVEIDGHNFNKIEFAINKFNENKGFKPFAIVMKTKKGCGVSYMENQVNWHGNAPNFNQFQIAKTELEQIKLKLKLKLEESM